jgi:hypothetical protein
MQVSKETYWLDTKTIFDIKNEARRPLSYIIGGLLAIIGIILTFRRIRALERQVLVGQDQLKVAQDQLQMAQEGQITDRFTRAIGQLGSDKMKVQLGGIYALERIANDLDKDYWLIMETLTAYVREHARWRVAIAEEGGEEAAPPVAMTTLAPTASPKPPTDIQAILTVLGRRKYHFDKGEAMRMDLTGTDLRGAALWKTHLEGANLRGANLEAANLVEAHLEGADFFGAHLKEAFLNKAHLKKANLDYANLEGSILIQAQMKNANFSGAHLEKARLSRANLEGAVLEEANLKGAKLGGAQFRGAYMEGAHMERASLRGTHLEGADLSEATGLTRNQLAQAVLDESLILPKYLQELSPEVKRPESGNKK